MYIVKYEQGKVDVVKTEDLFVRRPEDLVGYMVCEIEDCPACIIYPTNTDAPARQKAYILAGYDNGTATAINLIVANLWAPLLKEDAFEYHNGKLRLKSTT